MKDFFENIWINMNRKKAALTAIVITAIIILIVQVTGKADNEKKVVSGNAQVQTSQQPGQMDPNAPQGGQPGEMPPGGQPGEMPPEGQGGALPGGLTEEPAPEGKEWSRLTHLAIDKAVYVNRPFAVMIDNSAKGVEAQYGLSDAEIVYETMLKDANGNNLDVTKLMAIYEQFNVDKVGPISSLESFYPTVAKEYDAVLVSNYASDYTTQQTAKELDMPNLNGNSAVLTGVLWDKSCTGKYSMFTTGEKLKNALVNKRGLKLDFTGNPANHAMFNNMKLRPQNAPRCKQIQIKFSDKVTVTFDYDETKEKYMRSQNGQPHIDKATGEQLAYDNIIVLYMDKFKNKNGEIEFAVANSTGTGTYFTMDSVSDMTWSKKTLDYAMTYMTIEGNDLHISPGNIYYAIVDVDSNCITTKE